MSRFANLADKPKANPKSQTQPTVPSHEDGAASTASGASPSRSNSRTGRKAIAAYFSPEMSLAMHVCARKRDISLQELMAEAFDDVLRKYGESPIGG
jgi:hypothetical protein